MKKFSCFIGFLFLTADLIAQKTSNPEAPKESYSISDTKTEKVSSTISIPFDIAIADIEKKMNSTLAGLIYEDNSYTNNQNDNLKCKVWKRANIAITAATNDVFDISVPLKIWAEKGISVFGYTQYNATEFEVNLKFTTKFSLTPDWKFQTTTYPKGYDWVSKPTLKVAGFDVPISAIIGTVLDNNLTSIARKIDESVLQNGDLKPYIIKAWNTAQQPYLVSEEYKTWLKITPIAIQMTPLTALGRSIKSSIALQVFTETYTGNTPSTPPIAISVPNLQLVQQVPDDFKIALISEIPHEQSAAIAKKMFAGQTFEFQNGKFKVKVNDISIYGSQDKMVIKADMTGSLNGSIYLKGLPVYDATRKQIILKGLDYDLKTKNVLAKAASWFLEGKMIKMMENQYGVPVEDLINYSIKNVQDVLSQPLMKGVKVTANIGEVTPSHVYMTPEGLVSVVFAKGTLNLKVDGLD